MNLFQPDYFIKKIIRKDLLSVMKYIKGDLLDIGCGKRPYYKLFKKSVRSYTGLDARSDTADIKEDIFKAKMKPNSFDTVLCTQVLEHVPEPYLLIQLVYKVVRPGGYAVFTAPLIASLHEHPYDYFRFTRYGLAYLFNKAGFEIIEIRNEGDWILSIESLQSFYFESTFNRYFLFYVKRIILGIHRLFVWTVHILLPEKYRRAFECPLNYLVLVRKRL